MQYPLTVPGFENRQLILETAGVWSGAKLLLDGEPASKGPKRGQFLLRRLDGTEVVAHVRVTNFLDPIPQVVIDGKSFLATQPLKWYQWAWGGLPFLLLIIGGALGGLFGGIALVVNGRVFRSNLNGLAKYLLSGLVSALAVGAFFVVAVLFNLTLLNFAPKIAREFKSEAGGFSVITPYTLKETVQSVDTQAGAIDIHIFSADRNDTSLLVGYSDYPVEIVKASDPEKMLDGSRDGAVTNVKGELVAEVKTSLNNFPGRELTISAKAENGQEMILRGRIFLVDNRLYQVMAITSKGKGNSAEIGDFLASFKLLGK